MSVYKTRNLFSGLKLTGFGTPQCSVPVSLSTPLSKFHAKIGYHGDGMMHYTLHLVSANYDLFDDTCNKTASDRAIRHRYHIFFP